MSKNFGDGGMKTAAPVKKSLFACLENVFQQRVSERGVGVRVNPPQGGSSDTPDLQGRLMFHHISVFSRSGHTVRVLF